MRKNSLSVIVPVHNVEQYIECCLTSLSAIEGIDVNFILAENASSDSSYEICKKFAEKDSRFVLMHLDEPGVSNARNKALGVCDSEYVAFVDADDWIDADAFVSAFTSFTGFNCDMGISSYVKVENGVSQEQMLDYGESRLLSPEEKMVLLQTRVAPSIRFMGSVWRNFYSRKLISSLSFDVSLPFQEDFLFNLFALGSASSVAIINKSFYYYRVNNNSASFKRNVNTVEFRIMARNRMAEWAKDNGVDLSFALIRRNCPILARQFANAAHENSRGIGRVKALWKIHRAIPNEESKQWRTDFWGKSFAPYSLCCRYGLRLLGFLYLCLRFF